jgi:hypothetical protein
MKLSYNDAQHAYWLDGVRCKSVTTVAKIPDDTYSLDQWRKRQILVGVALRPQLVERAAAHFDDRDIIDRLAEEALEAAKSHDAANRGTAAHRIAERVDLGQTIIDTPQARAVQAAWERALMLAGLEIVPELVERIVVYPERRIAGRFDRMVRRKIDGRLCVLDLKTGMNAVKYPHSMAIQLALYANAPLIAGPLDGRGQTEKFDRPPDIDRTVGYVIHMVHQYDDDGTVADQQVDVVGVDLEQGWKAAQLCFDTIDWRSRKDLILPIAEIKLESPDRTEWIQGRLKALSGSRQARDIVTGSWPPQVPYRPPWTDGQIDLIDGVLAAAERLTEAFFPPADPTIHTTRKKIPA